MVEKFFLEKEFKKDLELEAKALGIASGARQVFVEKINAEITTKLKKKKIITKRDLEKITAEVAKQYNADFAYVYQNRDKIV